MNAFWIEQVEAYLEGQISRADLQAIAEREGIEDVEQEIAWLRDSQLAIEAVGLKEQLDHILPKAAAREPQVRSLRLSRTLLAVAAGILVLVIAFFAINQETAPDLYAEYEYLDPGPPVLMSQSEEHLFYDAMTYYGEENYSVAATKLQGLLQASPNNDTIAYYLGASQLYLNQAADAQISLQQVVTDSTSEFQSKAQWLQVLCALRMDQFDAVQQKLTPILTNPEHPFFARASQLQESISKLDQ